MANNRTLKASRGKTRSSQKKTAPDRSGILKNLGQDSYMLAAESSALVARGIEEGIFNYHKEVLPHHKPILAGEFARALCFYDYEAIASVSINPRGAEANEGDILTWGSVKINSFVYDVFVALHVIEEGPDSLDELLKRAFDDEKVA